MPEAPRIQTGRGDPPPPDERSRLERLDEGVEPPLPPCDYMPVIDWLFEVGPVAAGGMGPAALAHAEIAAWAANTGMALSEWDARILRQLSREYLAQLHSARAMDAAPPWTAEPTPERRKVIAQHIRGVLRS